MAEQKQNIQSSNMKPEDIKKDERKEVPTQDETEKAVGVPIVVGVAGEGKQVLHEAPSVVGEAVKEPLVEAQGQTQGQEEGKREGEDQLDTETALDEEEVEELRKSRFQEIEAGMKIKVYQKIKEKTAKGVEREREQVFEGIVLARKHGRQAGATITVRKISHGVGVEKIFPLQLPTLMRIGVVSKLRRKRRSKLYFLRDYKKRLKETKIAIV